MVSIQRHTQVYSCNPVTVIDKRFSLAGAIAGAGRYCN